MGKHINKSPELSSFLKSRTYNIMKTYKYDTFKIEKEHIDSIMKSYEKIQQADRDIKEEDEMKRAAENMK